MVPYFLALSRLATRGVTPASRQTIHRILPTLALCLRYHSMGISRDQTETELLGAFLLLAGEKALEEFRTLLHVYLRAGFKKGITHLGHAAAFTIGDRFKVLLQAGVYTKCESRILSHRSRILSLFRNSFVKTRT